MPKNISFEFLIEPYKTSSGMRFNLAQAKRSYLNLELEMYNFELSMDHIEHYFSIFYKSNKLDILEAESPDQFILYGPGSIRKKIFLLSKNEKVLALLEMYSPINPESYLIQLFIKKINDEELRLMLEHVLSKEFVAILIPLRDQLMSYVSSIQSTSFQKVLKN